MSIFYRVQQKDSTGVLRSYIVLDLPKQFIENLDRDVKEEHPSTLEKYTVDPVTKAVFEEAHRRRHQ